MKTPKVYLETTVFNFYFDTERDAHNATIQLFKEIKEGIFEAYTSTYVIDEIKDAKEPKRSNMIDLIIKYNINVLNASDEAGDLANVYTESGMIPAKYRYDGLHIACAVINDMEYIFSYNFKHINRQKTKVMSNYINVARGYKPIIIAHPQEVVEYADNE